MGGRAKLPEAVGGGALIEITIDGVNFTPALFGEPSIQDQLNANCRILNFGVQQVKNPQQLVGCTAELLYNGIRWFKGEVKSHSIDATGKTVFVAYDPLFYLAKNPDDYYFKNQTATQIVATLAGKCSVKVASVANTGTVFPYLYYPGTSPEKIVIDVLARTKAGNGRKFWFRYDPVKDGVIVFERKLSTALWAFQLGVNLLSASKTDSIEELCTTVKLINRETGKVVTKTNADALWRYGKTQHFEEVNNDIKDVDGRAATLLSDLSKVTTTMNIAGVNPKGVMPQFFTGDAVYVEEPNTGMVGGYYIRNVTHTFKANDMVQIDADIDQTPELPAIQFDNADKKK